MPTQENKISRRPVPTSDSKSTPNNKQPATNAIPRHPVPTLNSDPAQPPSTTLTPLPTPLLNSSTNTSTNTLNITYTTTGPMLVLAPPRDKGPVEATCLHLGVSGARVKRENKKELMLPVEGDETVFIGTIPASRHAVGDIATMLDAAVSTRGEFWYERFLLGLLERQGRKQDGECYVVFQGAAERLSVIWGHGKIAGW